MTSFSLTVGGGQVHARPNKVKFRINISAFNAHVSDLEFSKNSKYAFSSLLRYLELPKIASK